MKRKLLAALLAVSMIATLMVGCGDEPAVDTPAVEEDSAEVEAETETPADTTEAETVSLVLWGGEEDQELLSTMVESFKAAYPDTTFDIMIGIESESTAKDTILTDIEAAADVFAFADDQINALVTAGALQEVTLDVDTIKAENGEASVNAASVDGVLYAYPMTADNGYFMYYNAEYFTEEDVLSMDRMIEVAEAAGKQITMQLNSGWYLHSFFGGAGLSVGLNDDGVTNYCDWNSTTGTYKGVDVAQAILDITARDGFVSLSDAEFQTGIADGSLIAGVNGVWNANAAELAWGDNYRATKLPTFTVAGEQVQMSSVAGFKLLGVNAYSENVGWAMRLAQWITNYDNQVLRFQQRQQGPSNSMAAASEEVQANPAIAALSAQSAYATPQRVGSGFWSPSESLGAIFAEGNSAGEDLQTVLDNAVAGITAAQ